MDGIGSAFPHLLWVVSWQAAVLAAVVWVVSRFAKGAPAAWRYGLWLIVVIKFLVPPFAYIPKNLAFWQYHERARISASVYSLSTPAKVASNVSPPSAGVAATASSYKPVVHHVATAGKPGAENFVLLVWLAGVGVMAVILIARCRRQTGIINESVPAGEDLQALLEESRMGVRRLPRLRLSDDATTPMVVGLIRPVILLPSGIADRCSRADLRAMLMHELAHIKRLDMVGVWIGQIARMLFFFHPAVWVAEKELRVERELACDEKVLSFSGIPRKEYAAGYISALRLANDVCRGANALAMAEPFEIEKRRVKRILHNAIPQMSRYWMGALLLVTVVGLPTFAGVASRFTMADVEGLSGREIMALVQEAREEAIASIGSGKGKVKVTRSSHSREGGMRYDGVSLYDVAFSGQRLKWSVRNDSQPETMPGKLGSEVVIGEVDKLAKREYAFDGRNVTSFEPRSKLAVIGDWQSGTGETAISNFQADVAVVDKVLPDLKRVLSYSGNRQPAVDGDPRVVGRETVNGDDCVVLEVIDTNPSTFGGQSRTVWRFWVAPGKGFAILRIRGWAEGDAYTQRTLFREINVRLRRYGDDLWGPARYTVSIYKLDSRTGAPYLSQRVETSYDKDFGLNVPVKEGDVLLKLPSGTKVRNEAS